MFLKETKTYFNVVCCATHLIIKVQYRLLRRFFMGKRINKVITSKKIKALTEHQWCTDFLVKRCRSWQAFAFNNKVNKLEQKRFVSPLLRWTWHCLELWVEIKIVRLIGSWMLRLHWKSDRMSSQFIIAFKRFLLSIFIQDTHYFSQSFEHSHSLIPENISLVCGLFV